MKTLPDSKEHGEEHLGAGWVDEHESAELTASLAGRVTRQQNKVAAEKGNLPGHVGRGQHEKQLLGAFGTLKIEDSIPPAAERGPFVKSREYKVACRISNGQPCPYHDQAPDVRGVAFKLFTPEGVETDFVMTNEGGRSHSRDAVGFTEVADLLVAFKTAGGKMDALRELAKGLANGALPPLEAARTAAILGQQTVLRKVHSMATEHFWGSVVMLGDSAVKYSLHPHTTTRAGTDADPQSANYLREDLENRLARGSLRFDLCLQFYVDATSTPVSDASVIWRAPLVPIGTLVIKSKPSDEDEALINTFAFNPGNGFEPLGITHARKVVYATSAKNRGALSSEEVRRHFTDRP